MVATQVSWWPDAIFFRSTDSGATWTRIWDFTSYPDRSLRYTQDISSVPWLTFGQQPSPPTPSPKLGWMTEAMEIDPFDSDHLLYGTGATIGGFRHDNLDAVPSMMYTSPVFTTTTSLDFAELNPSVIVRTGLFDRAAQPNDNRIAFSTDGGKNWFQGTEPGGSSGGGTAAAAADGSRFVWSSGGAPVSYSAGFGTSWTASSGIPSGATVAADRVDPKRFYGFAAGKFYTSTDGGASFTASAATGLDTAPATSSAWQSLDRRGRGQLLSASGRSMLALTFLAQRVSRKSSTMTNSREVAPRTGRGPATITDVANAAGVSPSTVSYVITGKRTISAATRRRVEESIRTLGYRRNGGSPAPRPARIGVLAMTVPLYHGPAVGMAMESFAAAAEAARERRFHLLLVIHDEGGVGLHQVMSAALADAVIALDVTDDDPRVPILLAAGRPAVLIGARGRHHGLASVDFDFAAAGHQCVSHLADLGHRSIAHLGTPPGAHDRRMRDLTGFLEGAHATAARRAVRAVFRPCAASAESTARCLDDLLTPWGPTGLVVHDEALIPLVLAMAGRRGLRVPDDVSVVGMCSDTATGHQHIRPTAVVVPARELSALAVEQAVGQLDGEPVAELELLAPRLVVGDSTAAPPTR